MSQKNTSQKEEGVLSKTPPIMLDHYINQVLAINAKNQANQLAWMVCRLTMAAIPHSRPDSDYFERKCGHHTLSMVANPKYGLPYGSIPQILFAAIINEVEKTKSPVVRISKLHTKLVHDLKNINRVASKNDQESIQDQMLRLFSTSISCCYKEESESRFTDKDTTYRTFNFWWNPFNGSKENILSSSTTVLTKDFFNIIVNFPIKNASIYREKNNHA